MDRLLAVARRDSTKPVICQKKRGIYKKYASSPRAESANSYSFASDYQPPISFTPGLRKTLRTLP